MHRFVIRDSYLYVAMALLFIVLTSRSIHAQLLSEETLAGPDAHEEAPEDRGHLFGKWDGRRQRLLNRGFALDLQYLSDQLWNTDSVQKTRLASWNRVRGTIDLNLGRLAGLSDTYVHITALWQGGGNMGTYLGLVTGPSGMASANTFRLDSWWIEKRLKQQRIAVRVGQFAGQDFYGAQHFAASFIFEPMGYALSNLSNTYEVFDPPSTPAAEVRVAPVHHLYVKSMVMAGDRIPYAHNSTGLVPQFRGAPVVTSEVGFSPGKDASSIRAFDDVAARRGYSGLYQFGSAYNPGKFAQAGSTVPRSGNELLYFMGSQSVYRTSPDVSRGLDATAAFDWSPAKANVHDRLFTAGLRFNEPLPIRRHNSISLGYVQSAFSPFYPDPATGAPRKSEHGLECNVLLDVNSFFLLQPVAQYYINTGGSNRSAVVLGFRTKVDF